MPYLLISMILRHSQLGFAGVTEYSLAASMMGTYVFGLTSTAFVMSEARRRMTHALGRMPLLDAMAGVVCSALDVCAAHCRLPETLQNSLATTTTTTTKQFAVAFEAREKQFHMPRGCGGPNLVARRSRRKCHPRHVGI